jgi:hypothetical protein
VVDVAANTIDERGSLSPSVSSLGNPWRERKSARHLTSRSWAQLLPSLLMIRTQ